MWPPHPSNLTPCVASTGIQTPLVWGRLFCLCDNNAMSYPMPSTTRITIIANSTLPKLTVAFSRFSCFWSHITTQRHRQSTHRHPHHLQHSLAQAMLIYVELPSFVVGGWREGGGQRIQLLDTSSLPEHSEISRNKMRATPRKPIASY